MNTPQQYSQLDSHSQSSQDDISPGAIPKDGHFPVDSEKPASAVQGSYEMVNFQTAKQGQPPTFPANSDPEIGLNDLNNNDPSLLLSYHEIYSAGHSDCWRPFVGLLALGFGVSFLGGLVVYIIFQYIYRVMGSTFEAQQDPLTPDTLAFTNLALATAIPIAGFLTKKLHGVHQGWLASVEKQIRWGWLLTCLGLSTLVLIATFFVQVALAAVNSTDEDGLDDIEVNKWNDITTDFLLVILITTPLQAAAEEYAFRGYLTQAFGGLCSKVGAVLVPSFLFALAHGDQTGPVFLDRFAFGVVSGLLVVETGGLEAGIAMHILNNFVAFIFAVLFSDMTTAMHPTSENWWRILVTMTQSLGYYFLAVKVARKKNIQTSVSKLIVEEKRT